jgi:hypothetical protein
MSTRATYRFEAGETTPAITYYIHHDGYLEGAAGYFLAALLFENRRGGLPAQFLRANDGAEFTGSHATHGDTEYRYTVTPDHDLLAEKRIDFSERWAPVFQGRLRDFVQRCEGTQLTRYRGQYLSHDLAIVQVMALLADLKRLLEGGHTGNASSTANEVWALLQLLIAGWGEDDFTRLTAKTIDSADRYFPLAYGWNKDSTDEEAYQRWVKTFRTVKPEQEPQA